MGTEIKDLEPVLAERRQQVVTIGLPTSDVSILRAEHFIIFNRLLFFFKGSKHY